MNTATPYHDSILLNDLAGGSEAAMKRLFDKYLNRLYHYILRIVKSETVAEELVMDVFMKIWNGRTLLNEVKNFDAFLFRIARNKAIDFLRSASANNRFQELLWDQLQVKSSESADYQLLVKEYEKLVCEAVSLLSPQRRKVYTMRRDQQYSQEQIASQLNLSRSTVNNHLVDAQRLVHNYVSGGMDLALVIIVAKFI